jgi:hypothetical protein
LDGLSDVLIASLSFYIFSSVTVDDDAADARINIGGKHIRRRIYDAKSQRFCLPFLFDRTANLSTNQKLVFLGLSVILFDFELIFFYFFYFTFPFSFLTGHLLYAAPGAALTGGDVLGQPQKFLTIISDEFILKYPMTEVRNIYTNLLSSVSAYFLAIFIFQPKFLFDSISEIEKINKKSRK